MHSHDGLCRTLNNEVETSSFSEAQRRSLRWCKQQQQQQKEGKRAKRGAKLH